MKLEVLFVGFVVVAHVKCQLDVNVEDILYGEDEEEDDEELATTTTTTTTTEEPTTSTTTTTTQSTRDNLTTVATPLSAPTNLTNNATTSNQNFTLVATPANGTIFGSVLTPVVGAGVTTERVHYVIGQVGNIWNNVGKLNISGIVDHALGIRNNYIARPLVTGILNVVFCNPVTFSNNNCRKRAKDGNSSKNDTQA